MRKILRALLIRRKTCGAGLVSGLGAVLWPLFISGCAMVQSGGQSQTGKFEFGLIGDLPYNAEDERKFPNLIEDIKKANLVFVIHDGDFQADFRGYRDGSLPCSDETFDNRKNLAQTFKPPFILTPGDNDWTDCHYVKSASYDPLERLAKLREIFFSGTDFGQQTLSITRQSSDPKYSKFRENLRWTYGDMLFVTLHLVGSDNNFGRTSEMDAEYAERNSPNTCAIDYSPVRRYSSRQRKRVFKIPIRNQMICENPYEK